MKKENRSIQQGLGGKKKILLVGRFFFNVEKTEIEKGKLCNSGT